MTTRTTTPPCAAAASTAAPLVDPQAVVEHAPKLVAEWAKIALGLSDVPVPERDPQFRDPLWRENPAFRRLAQAHVAWTGAVEDVLAASGDALSAGRARYWANIVTGALSPANFLATNPAALRKAVDTGGASLVQGARNYLRDVATNNGMPRMVDTSGFTVGGNMACSPGAVVHREEMFEVIQYAPATDLVRERPLLFVPPQIGRYYILDLAPGRSLVEHAVDAGVPAFMLVWRNPDSAQGHGQWGFDDYVAAVVRAFAVVCEVAGTDDLNVLGFCAGGLTSAVAQAYLAARGAHPVHSCTYLVTMLDTRLPNMISTVATDGLRAALDGQAARGEVLPAALVARNFAWMRPKDLVFGQAVSNWLLGEKPSAYDLLAWNDDAANVSARFARDSVALMASGDLLAPGKARVLDTEVDLSHVTADTFVVTAETDHITTWRPCYLTSQVLGGDSEVVLVNKGHIQTVVSPVEGSRQKYWVGPAAGADPDAWRAGADQRTGSWWTRWEQWLLERSGPSVPAPTALGGPGHPATDPAPGRYVHEK